MRRTPVSTCRLLVVICCVLATSLAPSPAMARDTAPAVPSESSAQGTYVSVTPARAYDTRINLRRALKPGESLRVRVAGRDGVPAAAQVEAVVVNLTTTGATRNGYLAAYPSDSQGTGVSTLTFAKGDTRAVLATVPIGPDGYITIRNAGGTGAGSAHAIVDTQGYYLSASSTPDQAGSEYQPAEAFRAFDTREYSSPFDPYSSYDIPVFDDDGSIDALVVNLTAVAPQAAGYLTAYRDAEQEPPHTSSVNFARGRTTTNQVVVPVVHRSDAEGPYVGFGIYVGTSRSVHVLADVVGVYDHGQLYGQRFVPLRSPVRVANSITGTGGIRTLGPRGTGRVDASSVVDDDATVALVGTLTATRSSAATFLTVWSGMTQRPEVSSLNPARGQTVSNQAIIEIDTVGDFSVYNQAGRSDVLYDVAGRFDVPPDASGESPDRGSLAASQRRAVTAEAPASASDRPIRRFAHR